MIVRAPTTTLAPSSAEHSHTLTHNTQTRARTHTNTETDTICSNLVSKKSRNDGEEICVNPTYAQTDTHTHTRRERLRESALEREYKFHQTRDRAVWMQNSAWSNLNLPFHPARITTKLVTLSMVSSARKNQRWVPHSHSLGSCALDESDRFRFLHCF